MLQIFTILLINFWYYFLSFFILGITLTLIFQKGINRIYRTFIQKILLLKRYWGFVIPFSVLAALGYILLFNFTTSIDQIYYIEVYNQCIGLIFAIFVGYFAFVLVIENRMDKFKQVADGYLNQKLYPKAIENYERCIDINSKQFEIWANLMELYLIQSRDSNFDEKIETVKGTIKYPDEEIIFKYLLFTKCVLKEQIGEAKEMIKKIISYIQNDESTLKYFRWGFSDVEGSERFNKLGTESKKIYNNLSRYLLRSLSAEEKTRFEQDDYELNPIQKVTS